MVMIPFRCWFGCQFFVGAVSVGAYASVRLMAAGGQSFACAWAARWTKSFSIALALKRRCHEQK
jgi:hypothetical protein